MLVEKTELEVCCFEQPNFCICFKMFLQSWLQYYLRKQEFSLDDCLSIDDQRYVEVLCLHHTIRLIRKSISRDAIEKNDCGRAIYLQIASNDGHLKCIFL